MREDDEFGHYVPLLRRIIILVAVITAVPVVLWTITAFVRTYVGPPKVPTFHQLASTASINAPAGESRPEGTAQLQAAMQAKLASQSAGTNGAPDAAAAPKGALLADRAPDATAASSVPPQSAGANLFPPSPLAAPDNATPGSINPVADAQPTATESDPDALPAAAPISGPVPLPRHRPHNIDAVRTADGSPSNVPMPRPRPDAAGAGAASETTGGGPVGFIQNLFH
jgi:hypothetical protein